MMKLNDSGDFCVLYVEPGDERDALLPQLAEQKKPAVLLLAEQSKTFHSPEDFNVLKHVKRQLTIPIVFVIPSSERLTQLAGRNGFPVYSSMDELSEALANGQFSRQRRISVPLQGTPQQASATALLAPPTVDVPPRRSRTVPLQPATGALTGAPKREEPVQRKTVPLQPATDPLTAPPKREEPAQRKTVPLRSVASTQPAHPVDIQRLKTRPLQPPAAPEPPALPQRQPAARPRKHSSGRSSLVALAVLMLIALVVAGLGSFMVFFHGLPLQGPAAAPDPSVGRIAFFSSEQVSEASSQGIDDKVLIELTNLPAPAATKGYYAWLLGDHNQSDMRSFLLGALKVNQGRATFLYPGDAAHTNLLLLTSRFLVTEEDASVTPVTPSPDPMTWRFYGEFPQQAAATGEKNANSGVKSFTFLDHLRHLLAADPTLDQMELPGGLNAWFYRNTSKLLEWTTSMREPWEDAKNVDFVRRQAIRVLDYLDGVVFVAQDLPPNTPVLVNPRLGSVGLLEVNGPAQDPPSYITHIVHHLNGLLQAGKFTPQLREDAAKIVTGLNSSKQFLEQARVAARELARRSNAQLQQADTLTLINALINAVTQAYTGQPDPVTNEMHQGVSWIHEHMQSLASLQVQLYKATSSSIQMVEDIHRLRAHSSGLEVA